jgi:putative ABC transport system permease protein
VKKGFARTAARIAVAELRAAPGKLAFTVLAVALGGGMLTGVRGLSDSFLKALLLNARDWMAADVQIRLSSPVSPEQRKIVDQLALRGIRSTVVTGTLAMAAPEFEQGVETVAVKAVDPSEYPFYGDLQVEPAAPLRNLLTGDAMICSPELLERFHLKPGDSLVVGGAAFRIAGVLRSEPDRFAVTPVALNRVLVSIAGFERTSLLRFGNRGVYRLLLKLPAALDPAAIRPELEAAFPEAEVTDYRENDPDITNIVEKTTAYLSLISSIGLIVGSLGVAMALYSHIEQRLEMIAMMKVLGGRARQVLLVFGIQTGLIWLVGSGLGLLLGLLMEIALLGLVRRYVPLETGILWNSGFALQSSLAMALCLALATFPVLLRARGVPPLLILRRDMMERGQTRWNRRVDVKSGIALLAGFWLLGSWIARSWSLGGVFVLGGLVACGLCAVASAILLRGLRGALSKLAPMLSATLRQGSANVCRPGNQAGMVVMALGAGVACLFTGYLLEGGMTDRLLEWSPVRDANLFVANIGAKEAQSAGEFLKNQPGVEQTSELAPFVSLRLAAVDGVPVDSLPEEIRKRLYRKNWYATTAGTQPPELKTVSGAWWQPGEREPVIAFSSTTAAWMRVDAGSLLEFSVNGRRLRARVAMLHRSSGAARLRYELTFNPPALDGLPLVFNGGLLVEDKRMDQVKRAITAAYPDVVLVDMSDVRRILDGLVGQAVTVFRFLAFFAIFAGASTLGASVAGTRARRVREMAVFKLLGATPSQVAWIQAVEFSLLGAVAGLLGTMLGAVAALLLLHRVLEAQAGTGTLLAALIAIAATALVANAAGWLANLRILGARPLPVLRED